MPTTSAPRDQRARVVHVGALIREQLVAFRRKTANGGKVVGCNITIDSAAGKTLFVPSPT